MPSKAIILCGGWDGHEPKLVSERFRKFLESEGFEVAVEEKIEIFKDKDRLAETGLFVPVWTMCTEPLGYGFFETFLEAAGAGMGVAGCHGGMCDAFRNSVEYQFLTGANWVSHPGGDGVKYRVNIKNRSTPLTEGINDFDIASEQYYLHVDPANEVLATTRFPTVRWYHSANGEADVPQVWTRRWGYGRVFYSALGHHDDVFNVPEAWELMKRGLLWAAEGGKIAREKGFKAEDWKTAAPMY
jgi:type 1 glutamine amidotransferase